MDWKALKLITHGPMVLLCLIIYLLFRILLSLLPSITSMFSISFSWLFFFQSYIMPREEARERTSCTSFVRCNDMWLAKDNRFLNPMSTYERNLMAPTCLIINNYYGATDILSLPSNNLFSFFIILYILSSALSSFHFPLYLVCLEISLLVSFSFLA